MFFFDVRFISSSQDIHAQNTDFRVFKYESNKKVQNESASLYGKRNYIERRGHSWSASAKRPTHLKKGLQELEERLHIETPLLTEWRTPNLLSIVFSSGLIVYVVINPHTHDVTRIFFDRYCVGKIPANATKAVFTDTHILFTYVENVCVLISFNPPTSHSSLEKICSRDPKCQTVELYGCSRKCEKRLSATSRLLEARVLVWSCSNTGDLFPWSPTMRGEDRANIHIYSLNKNQMNLLHYHRLENEALSVELSQLNENVVYAVEQKSYEKGGLSVESSTYLAEGVSLRARACSTLRVPAPARCVRRSPCETRLLLACIDATLLVHHEATAVTRSVKAAFIPSLVRWSEGLVVACEERGRLQCFDLSLSPLPASTAQEDAKFLDIGAHLKSQRTIAEMQWNTGQNAGNVSPLLAVCFEGGPIALLHFTLTDFVKRWLSEGQVARVTSLLRALSWHDEGDLCLHILHTTVNHLFRKPLSPSRELALQEALGSFHAPEHPLSEQAVAAYGAPLHDLTRKFFHHLVRYDRLDKALSLAVDLNDSDLFMDVAYAARRHSDPGHAQLAREATQHALNALSDHSTCSDSCCSQCGSDTISETVSECETSSEDQNHRCDRPSSHARSAPPLPHVSSSEPPLPAPVIPRDRVIAQEAAPGRSIRPNLHQYLDRDCALWSGGRRETKPTHKVVDIIPRPGEDTVPHYSIYQAELKETNSTQPRRPYRSVYEQKYGGYSRNIAGLAFVLPESKAATSRHQGEKNVKFSDTVTVAVVPEIPRKERISGNISLESGLRPDPRKELADSLPLCHPNHDYLRDFAPAPPPHPPDNDKNDGTQGKIKVVHFGMV